MVNPINPYKASNVNSILTTNISPIIELSDQQRLHLLQHFYSDLELDKVLSNLLAELEQLIPVTGYKLESSALDCHRTQHGDYNYTVTESYQYNHLGAARLSLYLEKELLPRQQLILNDMLSLFSGPLKQALNLIKLERNARTDSLTGLGNKGYFEDTLNDSIARMERKQQQHLSLLLLDLNLFKQINDQYGHHCGDQVLAQFAKVVEHNIRKTDHAFRIGGDEFAIVLNAASPSFHQQIIQRICDAVTQDKLLSQYQLTSSYGIALWHPTSTRDSLFKQADIALYDHKFSARADLSPVQSPVHSEMP